MNKPEYMLLEYVLQMYVPICCLAASNISEMFNLHAHNLPPSQLFKLLNRMFKDGDLLAARPVSQMQSLRWFTPSEDEVQAGLEGSLDLIYCMTPQGGSGWEKATDVDWSRLVVTDMDAGIEMQEITMESLDGRMIEEQMVMRGVQTSFYLDLRTIHWKTVASWQATYWKTLPNAHRLRVRGRDSHLRGKASLFNHYCRAYQEWFSKEPRWYVSPWR